MSAARRDSRVPRPAGRPGPFLRFDFPGQGERGEPLCFAAPDEVILADNPAQVRPALRAVQRAADRGCYAAGMVTYEAAPAFDSALRVFDSFLRVPPASPLPLVWFGIFARPLPSSERGISPFHLTSWQADVSRADYARAIRRLHAAIAAGEIYQVNHTLRLRARLAGDALACYHRLRSAQTPCYGAYLDLGDWQILSVSPELFFQRAGDSFITRPMKGTRRRGRTDEEDRLLAAELASSEKDRAENVMIVDLLRSDVGKIARPGSVQVPELFRVEPYPTTYQMTSTVAATLKPEISLEGIFSALFPCGSVTGAPKVRAMSLIADLEAAPRQIYCGAIGLVKPGGQAACFSVAIRTLLRDARTGEAEYGVGGGITWDSVMEAEHAEAMSKAAVLDICRPSGDWALLETLRLQDGAFWLLERHLERLAASAVFFDISLRLPDVRDALAAHATAAPPGLRRVRLLVSQTGECRVEDSPLALPESQPALVAPARVPVSRHDSFLSHKTTRRDVYEARWEPGYFDTLLWNEEGELTEFTRGNLVLEQNGRRWTPYASSGLLPGVFRAELLAQGELQERCLTLSDLPAADRIWLINSVRGWVPVTLAAEGFLGTSD